MRKPLTLPFTQSLFPFTLLLLAWTTPGAAQVGHPPDASPFRDLKAGHSITPLFGYVGGSGGPLGVGPHKGTTIGLRYDLRTASTIQFGLGYARGNLERLVVNPFVALANRTSGPFEQTTSFVDLSVQLNLTGGKSWHRLAPYASLGAGLAFGNADVASDSSGYEFGNKFYVAPAIGTIVLERTLDILAILLLSAAFSVGVLQGRIPTWLLWSYAVALAAVLV